MECISVIVTAHNCASWIEKALASVADALALFEQENSQTAIPDREVLLVDDGSSDATPQLAQRFLDGRAGWRLLRRPKATSPACARNYGARQARGAILFFLDGDDLFLPPHLIACYRALHEGGCDYVKTAVQLASPVHPDWKERIENSIIINVAIRNTCHEAIGGFPDFHLFRRIDEQLIIEADVFYKIEDMFYNQLLSRLFCGRKLDVPTVEYCRYPGNGYDRQYEKFRHPFGQYAEVAPAEERFRLQLGEIIFQHLLPRLEGECQKRLGRPTQSSPILQAALRQQQAGDRVQAERLCRQVLQAEPGNAEAWQLLGTVLYDSGKLPEAIDAFRRALSLCPTDASSHYRLALALASLGQRAPAIAHFRQALHLQPDHGEALAHLGVALAEEGQRQEAIACFQQALRLHPTAAPTLHNLGVAQAQEGRLAEAVESLERAVQCRPDYADAHYSLGTVLDQMGRQEEAIARFRRCLQLQPNHAGACNNLGLGLTEAKQPHEAVTLLQHAIRLRPDMKEAHNNLGLTYTDLGRFAEAENCFREALRLDSRYAEAHSNLGNTYKEQGRLEEALACYQLTLWLKPDAVTTRYNRSLALLQQGNYAEGWKEYEWRWKRPQTPPRPFGQPRWNGSCLPDKTILLWSEQGLGDTIQFVRYASVVKERVGRVIFYCPPPLVPLLSGCPGVDQIVAEGEIVTDFDVQAPLMSLPAICGTTLATVPADIPYVQVDPERVAAWRERLPGGDSFRIGIIWQGNPRHGWDRHRSAPLLSLEPLARLDGVSLVSLQKGPGREQIGALGERFTVLDWGDELDASSGAFVDTAAVMQSLDLVVTVDTAAAHLAGALGVPVWLALARIADWRWLRDCDDTPWYPSMRIFRQKQVGDWRTVFEGMAEELRPLVAARHRSARITVEVVPGELLDRLTILEIKSERLTDATKRAVVVEELAALRQARDRAIPPTAELSQITAALRAVNEGLWDSEDRLRRYEQARDFGHAFVEQARSIYLQNDRRAALKQQINLLLGAGPGEPKAYADYRHEKNGVPRSQDNCPTVRLAADAIAECQGSLKDGTQRRATTQYKRG
jgi:tetratricopeptide (TPR) repeat protein